MSVARRANPDRAPDSLNALDFRRIIEASPSAIWLLQTDGRVEYANRRALDCMRGEVSSDWRLFWPSDSQKTADRALATAAAGEPFRFTAFLALSPDAHVYLETEVAPLPDTAGRPARLLATSRDVTREVEESAFLRGIVQQLPLALTVKDVQTGRYVLFNRSAETLYDLEADDAVGRTGVELFSPPRAAAIHDADERAIGSFEARKPIVEQGPTESGPRYFATRRAVTFDDAGPRHLMTLTEDVTDQRASSEALREALRTSEQASEAKSAFLANMSHEIRTPLNGVIAAAEMLAQDDLPEKQRKLTDLIRSSAETLHRLLSDVLDIARIETGAATTLEPAPFQLGDLVRELAAVFELDAKRRGLGFSAAIAPEADGWRLGDRLRIRQVITNLLGNAVKFTEEGSVSITLDAGAGDGLWLTVADTGIGFALSEKERIFDRFNQVDNSHSRRFGGAGLGLAICRELCEAMGAVLDCASEPGHGSRFWVEFDLPRATPATQPDAPEAAAPEGLKILVAEDNPANRAILNLMLGSVAQVYLVENGALAVEALRSQRFDLVLMDMQMPEMDGLDATRAIRAFERRTGQAPIPVIMLTANTHPDHVAASLAAGANLHLPKPITPSVLFRAMEDVLSASPQESLATA